MIITSCPLRISLVGGSTDHPWFIEKYGFGSVISFASNLRTYVSIHQDVFGANKIDGNFVLNYSQRESVKKISEIKNELIRHCFEYTEVSDFVNCSLTSDIFSHGSGLASSSSYLLGLIKSIFVMKGKKITEIEICKLAEKIEKNFNPLVGQQDFYGSIGGFKKINFYKNQDPQFTFLSTQIFDSLDFYLIHTGISRNSTLVLETLDIDKSLALLDDVAELELCINSVNITRFNEIINRSWANKKNTSKIICANPTLVKLDKVLSNDKLVLSHKLCGAGSGGYFLIFSEKNNETKLLKKYKHIKKIEISDTGLQSMNLSHGFDKI